MGERIIQRRLYWDFYGASSIVMPNFTPPRWYECDFFRVTRAGFFYEYEIKLSRSDFLADRKKHDAKFSRNGWPPHRWSEPKYLALGAGDTDGPVCFHYVVPESLTTKIISDLPEWAGLIEMRRSLRVVKKAPRLHSKKVSPSYIRYARHVSVSRYWDKYLDGVPRELQTND